MSRIFLIAAIDFSVNMMMIIRYLVSNISGIIIVSYKQIAKFVIIGLPWLNHIIFYMYSC